MFSTAYGIARKYTRPVMICKRFENKSVGAGLATFILLNKEGWALTAAHVMSEMIVAQQHTKERAEYQQAKKNPNESCLFYWQKEA